MTTNPFWRAEQVRSSGIISRDLGRGVRLRNLRSGDVVTIRGRKEDDSGWWLMEGGGLSDEAIEFVASNRKGDFGWVLS